LHRAEPLQCKPVTQIVQHQLFDLLRQRDACVADCERRPGSDLLCQFPCTRKEAISRHYLADNSQFQRFSGRQLLAGKQEVAAAVGAEHQRPDDMHAIAWNIRREDPQRKVIYLSAEKFMYRFIAAIRSQSTMEFKENLRSVDVLMIDDLQFLIGKDNTQEEFFHTFNYLVEQGKQIVVSADKSPSDLSGLEHRLRTRLGCGMVADLHSTTYELRISILEAKAARAALQGARLLERLEEIHRVTSRILTENVGIDNWVALRAIARLEHQVEMAANLLRTPLVTMTVTARRRCCTSLMSCMPSPWPFRLWWPTRRISRSWLSTASSP